MAAIDPPMMESEWFINQNWDNIKWKLIFILSKISITKRRKKQWQWWPILSSRCKICSNSGQIRSIRQNEFRFKYGVYWQQKKTGTTNNHNCKGSECHYTVTTSSITSCICTESFFNSKSSEWLKWCRHFAARTRGNRWWLSIFVSVNMLKNTRNSLNWFPIDLFLFSFLDKIWNWQWHFSRTIGSHWEIGIRRWWTPFKWIFPIYWRWWTTL